jgi:hypothetical protein
MNAIARLPHHIRHELGQRLEQGHQAQSILNWLNQLPEELGSEDLLTKARPLTHADLAEWRQNGYQQWLKDQEACEFVRNLAGRAEHLAAAAGDQTISDCLAAVLATELARSATALLAETTNPADRWQRLRELLHELARLRKGDHQAMRAQIERERWKQEHSRLQAEENDRATEKLKAKGEWSNAEIIEKLGVQMFGEDWRGTSVTQDPIAPAAQGSTISPFPTCRNQEIQPNPIKSDP